MTVEQPGVIDLAGIDPKTDELLLTITDHLPWDIDEDVHLLVLQEKINAYLQFIEGGNLSKAIPAADGRKPVIEIVAMYPPSFLATRLIDAARKVVETAGYGLRFQVSRLS